MGMSLASMSLLFCYGVTKHTKHYWNCQESEFSGCQNSEMM